MPQNNPKQKKKKKGHAPAHQNTFAFKHNPKSKLTERILNSPNVGVCRRCHDKIEWRKKYRKYKPRTQPGACNICRRRNVMAAYHTICKNCVYVAGDKIQLEKEKEKRGGVEVVPMEVDETNNSTTEPSSSPDDDDHDDTAAAKKNKSKTEETGTKRRIRACAVCTTEPVMNSLHEDDEDENDDLKHGSGGRLKLRERRALERKKERLEQEKRMKNKKENEEDGDIGKEGYESFDDYEGGEDEDLKSPIVQVS